MTTLQLVTQNALGKVVKGFCSITLIAGLSACAYIGKSTPPNNADSTASVPYTLSLEPLNKGNFPGLHSMIYVDAGDYIVLMAGRLNGLHGFPSQDQAYSNPSFPKDKKNQTAFLIEKATGSVIAEASVANLPSLIQQQLTATNTQFTVQGNILYIVGGYGYAQDTDSMRTLNQVTAINVDDLVDAIKHNKLDTDFSKASVSVGTHPSLAITGGELEQAASLGNSGRGFLLIFGHQFDGVFSIGGGSFYQQYSESVRKFAFNFGASAAQQGKDYGKIDVELIWQNPAISRTRPAQETEEYHRRDLTIRPTLTPQGEPQITAFGGVFKPGQMAGYLNPINIVADDPSNQSGLPQTVSLNVDKSTEQLMGQYEAGSISLYSEKNSTFYHTIFGGISQFYWKDGALHHDKPDFTRQSGRDGLPFINTVSTLKFTEAGSGQYLHKDQVFPPADAGLTCNGKAANYLGAETVFVHANEFASADNSLVFNNEAILLDEITKPTVVGYLIGGIASTAAYPSGKTCASPTYYKVTLTPNQTTNSVKLSLPSIEH
ncbi:hypothetical protein [Alteromonas sp. a30]|uniref:hypothetical protein n=1 Tax=Alteromonas sp. a30 TaxID=2730917 RepID=UPI00227E498E|nr:hypothetical protein [Alteromonas sp. a30]MCY7297250.1 hypothetical protein [Alteromonas sp. a30]